MMDNDWFTYDANRWLVYIMVNDSSKWSVDDGQSKHAQPIDRDQTIVKTWLFMIQHWQWFNLVITWSLWEIKRWQWDHPPLAACGAEPATMHGSLSLRHDDLIDWLIWLMWLMWLVDWLLDEFQSLDAFSVGFVTLEGPGPWTSQRPAAGDETCWHHRGGHDWGPRARSVCPTAIDNIDSYR